MTELTELQTADAYCRYLARRHYENFSVLSWFLPGSTRFHLARIYAFCRTTDDFGDESRPDEGNQTAVERLQAWRDQVSTMFERPTAAIHPVLMALSVTVRECEMPREPFLDLIQANLQDQEVSSYETWDDLIAYCMLSAAPVGRMVLKVFGITDARAVPLSDDVCIGLQIANHAQDVRRDAERGRSYVVQTDLRRGGVSLAVQTMCDRAAGLLASGQDLEPLAPLGLRAQLALYRLGGIAIVSAIRRVEYRTDITRPTVPAVTKARLVPHAFLECIARVEHETATGTA